MWSLLLLALMQDLMAPSKHNQDLIVPPRDAAEATLLGYITWLSSTLSLLGSATIIVLVLRFQELSKRFFATRLITFLALTNALAAAFNLLGALLSIVAASAPRGDAQGGDVGGALSDGGAAAIPEVAPVWSGLCQVQAVGLTYSNLSSILWTCCFAFTLLRDSLPSYRRHALRQLEPAFHLICWPAPAVAASAVAYLYDGPWCDSAALRASHAFTVCFLAPLLAACTFTAATFCAVVHHSRERRVTRMTSYILLGFAIVWLPSLAARAQVFFLAPPARPHGAPSSHPNHDPNSSSFALAALVAACEPLQGALNALVFGCSLPSIRDVYRALLLGPEGIDQVRRLSPESGDDEYEVSPASSQYSAPDSNLPRVSTDDYLQLPSSLASLPVSNAVALPAAGGGEFTPRVPRVHSCGL
jgi:hypothetical protein